MKKTVSTFITMAKHSHLLTKNLICIKNNAISEVFDLVWHLLFMFFGLTFCLVFYAAEVTLLCRNFY